MALNDYFYQGMSPEAYNTLLVDGERLYVPDHLAIDFFKLDGARKFGIPAAAHLTTSSDGVKVWQIVPAVEAMAVLWSWTLRPLPNGKVTVMRVPRGKGIYYACDFDELHTVQQETDFKLLMAMSGMGSGEGEQGEA